MRVSWRAPRIIHNTHTRYVYIYIYIYTRIVHRACNILHPIHIQVPTLLTIPAPLSPPSTASRAAVRTPPPGAPPAAVWARGGRGVRRGLSSRYRWWCGRGPLCLSFVTNIYIYTSAHAFHSRSNITHTIRYLAMPPP